MSRLPDSLKEFVAQSPGTGAVIRIPMETVAEQLPRGSVKISFGDLRQAAPAGVFSPANDQDQSMVELPLQEIVPQVSPALLSRRPNQKRIQVPDEVRPLFGPRGEPLSPTRARRAAAEAAPAAPAPPPAPVAGPKVETTSPPPPAIPAVPKPPAAPPSVPVTRPKATAAPVAPAPAAPAKPIPFELPKPAPAKPAAPSKPAAPIPVSAPLPAAASAPAAAPSQAKAAPPEKIPFKLPEQPPAAPAPAKPAAPAPTQRKPAAPGPIPFRVAETPAPARPAGPALSPKQLAQLVIAEEGVFAVKIESFIAGWPEAIQEEIRRLNLSNTTLAMPMTEIDQALRRGKVVFSWKQIRSSLRPPAPTGAGTEHDDVQAELPLPVIAPLFISQRKAVTPQRKVTIGDNIPSLFSRAPAAGGPGEPAEAEAQPAPPPAPAEPAGPDFGQIFGQPNKKNWTPTEVVQKTATLPGVDGASIVLQEGLQVASQLPPDKSGETFAAFLPQIFGRVSQYAKEMSLDEPAQLGLMTSKSVPLHIFKVGKIYFAVLGRAGQSLPLNQLTAIATQLGKQSK